jgi:hypothetical protein
VSADGNRVRFGIVGTGWRSEFFLRIARDLPERFSVRGLVTRSEVKGRAVEAGWGVKPYSSVEALVSEAPDIEFVVVSVPWEPAPAIIRDLSARGMPVLSETPPAPDLAGLVELNGLVEGGARIQVAEQYHLQPLHAARIAIASSGKLGEISHARVSVCHDYHAMSLMRKLLGVGFENAAITASGFTSSIVDGPGRDGGPERERLVASRQTIARLDFGKKMGIYDFEDDQYFSWIRSQDLVVRGTRGEIHDGTVRRLVDFRTPVEYELRRVNSGENGNLEGHHLKGILAGEEWVYLNPFPEGRLSDDEIAVASSLEAMARYVRGGSEFYSLAEAAQDRYLSIMVAESLKSGTTVTTSTQPWAR